MMKWTAVFILLLLSGGCSPALAPRSEATMQVLYGELRGNPENRLIAFSDLPPALSLNAKIGLAGQGGKLFVSNDPEYLNDSAVLPTSLYRDELVGGFRVFYHHANTTHGDLTFATAITNTQAAPLLLFTRGLGEGTNVHPDVAGQEARNSYLRASYWVTHRATLAPGESALIAPHTAVPGDTVSAVEEYVAVTPPRELAKHAALSVLTPVLETTSSAQDAASADQPKLPVGFSFAAVTVTVVAYKGKAPKAPQSLPVMPAGPSKPLAGTPYYRLDRGTFPFSDRYAEIALKFGSATMITLNSAVSGPFSHAIQGEYLLGTDATNGQRGFNNGNYGVIYNLQLCVLTGAPLGLPYALLMQPAGGFGHYVLQTDRDTVSSPLISYENSWWFYQVLAFGPKVCMSLRTSLTGGSFGPQKLFFVPFPLFE